MLRLEKRLSYSAIIQRLKVPKSTLSYWLRDLPLSEKEILELRRSAWIRGEASRELFRNTMRKKREANERIIYLQQLAKFRKVSRQALFVAGLMLYLGEGDKKEPSRIGIANTDPWILKFFIWWLQKFLDIPRARIRVELHLYTTMDIVEEKKFWRNYLDLSSLQFYKDQIRPLRPASFSYKDSYRHGTCKVLVGGVKEKRELMLAIKAFSDTHNKLFSSLRV